MFNTHRRTSSFSKVVAQQKSDYSKYDTPVANKKGFQRTTKVKLLDFDEATKAEHCWADTVEKAKQEIRAPKAEKKTSEAGFRAKRRPSFPPNVPYARRSSGPIRSAPLTPPTSPKVIAKKSKTRESPRISPKLEYF
jgi:hypothetical protein